MYPLGFLSPELRTPALRLPLEQHQETINPDEPRDFIDVYLNEIENEKDPKSSFFKEKGVENLIQTLSDLFFAGTETTR